MASPIPKENKEKTIHIHIHLSHKKLFLLLALLMLLIIAGIGYYLYTNNSSLVYDSSTGNSELTDLTPPSPPSDVQKILQKLQAQTKLFAPPKSAPVTSKLLSPLQVITPTPQIASISGTIRVPILMYHYVEYVQDKNDKTRISLNTTPYTLEQEVKTLSDAHYTFMTNNELADVLDGKSNLPQNPILLTFDDGYRDFYTDAYPILKKYHAKATQYVITGFLGLQNHLLPSQVKEIASDGLVEIGDHTTHHVWLKGMTLQQASPEIFQSRVFLEQLINKPVTSFAYPFGAFDDQAVRIVKAAGYRTAVSTLPGIEQNQTNRFFLLRLRPGGRQGQTLLNWLQQSIFSAF